MKKKKFDCTSMDARVWAKEFMRLFNKKKFIIDEDLMIAWFACAIMAGYDNCNWKKNK